MRFGTGILLSMDTELKELVGKIETAFNPVSIFLYGSRARTDFLERSDYEIGVLYQKDRKISRVELKGLNPNKSINLYPFEYESFINYKIDTPFPESIYFRELIQGGKTIAGKEVVEQLVPPPITVIDLLQRIRFDSAFALSAVLSQRQNDLVTSSTEFTKSCLFGLRCLIILEKRKFPLTYNDIYYTGMTMDLGEYVEVVKHAMEVRKGADPQELMLYKNISFLNKMVRDKILSKFQLEGDIIVLR